MYAKLFNWRIQRGLFKVLLCNNGGEYGSAIETGTEAQLGYWKLPGVFFLTLPPTYLVCSSVRLCLVFCGGLFNSFAYLCFKTDYFLEDKLFLRTLKKKNLNLPSKIFIFKKVPAFLAIFEFGSAVEGMIVFAFQSVRARGCGMVFLTPGSATNGACASSFLYINKIGEIVTLLNNSLQTEV